MELNPHLQFQPFFLLLLTHSSNLFSCIHFFLHNRCKYLFQEKVRKHNNHFTFSLPTLFLFFTDLPSSSYHRYKTHPSHSPFASLTTPHTSHLLSPLALMEQWDGKSAFPMFANLLLTLWFSNYATSLSTLLSPLSSL